MISAPIHRLTVDDYYALTNAGILREGDRIELLDGLLVDMMPINPPHGGSVDWLAARFHDLARGRWNIRNQNPVHLGEHDEPQPDLTLVRPMPDFYRRRHPQAADVFLLIEVSDSTLAFDRDDKLPVYARAGIAEVWIVNLIDLVVEVYRQPVAGAYTDRLIVRPGEPLAPAAFPDAGIDTAALLG